MSHRMTDDELAATPVGELTIEQFTMLLRQQFALVLREALERFHTEPRKDPDPPKFLDRDGLARAFSVELSLIDELRRDGLPVRLSVNGAPRFDVDDCIRWLDERNGPRVGPEDGEVVN